MVVFVLGNFVIIVFILMFIMVEVIGMIIIDIIVLVKMLFE